MLARRHIIQETAALYRHAALAVSEALIAACLQMKQMGNIRLDTRKLY